MKNHKEREMKKNESVQSISIIEGKTRKRSKSLYAVYKRFAMGVLFFCLSIGLCYADDDTPKDPKAFYDWALHLLSVFGQIKSFLQVIALLLGMFFVFSALNHFRTHHSNQGAQGTHLKHGCGHLVIGIFLMCIIPGIQMLQQSITKDLGDGQYMKFKAETDFTKTKEIAPQ